MGTLSTAVRALLFLFLELSFATPTPQPQDLSVRAVKCDNISKYTVKYFLDNKIFEPLLSTCLFYTESLTENAKRKTSVSALATIWDVWSCDLYNDKQVDTNPLRCIMGDSRQRLTYFEHMSEAYARSCGDFAALMTKDVHNIPQNGIWGRIEFPTLTRDPDEDREVNFISAFDEDFNNQLDIWERPDKTKPPPRRSLGSINATDALVKRKPADCFPPEEFQRRFGDLPW